MIYQTSEDKLSSSKYNRNPQGRVHPLCESFRFFHETFQNNKKLMHSNYFNLGSLQKNRQPNQISNPTKLLFAKNLLPKVGGWFFPLNVGWLFAADVPSQALEKFPLGNGRTRGSHASLERKISQNEVKRWSQRWIAMDNCSVFVMMIHELLRRSRCLTWRGDAGRRICQNMSAIY